LGILIIGVLQLHEEAWREKFLVYLEGSLYHEYISLVEKSKDLTPKCELTQQLDILVCSEYIGLRSQRWDWKWSIEFSRILCKELLRSVFGHKSSCCCSWRAPTRAHEAPIE
jgi:hypothetical protein